MGIYIYISTLKIYKTKANSISCLSVCVCLCVYILVYPRVVLCRVVITPGVSTIAIAYFAAPPQSAPSCKIVERKLYIGIAG